MSNHKANPFFKTCALIATGALFGYAISKNRFKSRELVTNKMDFSDVNKILDKNSLNKLLRDKLKNYPPMIERHYLALKPDENKHFRIMQWNILARALGSPDEFSKAPSDTYDWTNYRQWRTVQELSRFDSDIICIEEADVYNEIKNYLHFLGYTSVFCPKFSSPCLDMKENFGPDGCAIFYRTSKFQILNMSCEKVIINNEINSQVFVIMQLKHIDSGKLLTVVCLHLKSKAANHERRQLQIVEILKGIKVHLKGSLIKNLEENPLIICGDFNGEPFEKFYSTIINDENLKLRDAYSEIGEKKDPTTIKIRGSADSMLRRAIDYVFYSTNKIELVGLFELPKDNTLINEQGLPNLVYSSDHLSLICDFKFLD